MGLDARELVRLIVEECWHDAAAVERMREHVAPGYVHHTPFGDWTFEQFSEGMEWVESQFTDRSYHVEHAVVERDLAAAYLTWRGTRQADQGRIEGRGAYHCRIADGVVQEDWDVFFPAG